MQASNVSLLIQKLCEPMCLCAAGLAFGHNVEVLSAPCAAEVQVLLHLQQLASCVASAVSSSLGQSVPALAPPWQRRCRLTLLDAKAVVVCIWPACHYYTKFSCGNAAWPKQLHASDPMSHSA